MTPLGIYDITNKHEAHVKSCYSWKRHQMETSSALLALCAENSPVPGKFPAQSPVTRSFDAIFELHQNKRLSKQLWGCWFETPLRSLWCHCNDYCTRHLGRSATRLSFECQIMLNFERKILGLWDAVELVRCFTAQWTQQQVNVNKDLYVICNAALG